MELIFISGFDSLVQIVGVTFYFNFCFYNIIKIKMYNKKTSINIKKIKNNLQN